MITDFFKFLRSIGIPVCVALLIVACGVGAVLAETRYASKAELVEARAALKADFNIIRETQLAQSIREVHVIWCRESDEKNKNYWWAELQRYQSSYQSLSTNRDMYKTPPCPVNS